MAEGVEKRSVGDPVAQYKIYKEVCCSFISKKLIKINLFKKGGIVWFFRQQHFYFCYLNFPKYHLL